MTQTQNLIGSSNSSEAGLPHDHGPPGQQLRRLARQSDGTNKGSMQQGSVVTHTATAANCQAQTGDDA